MMKKTYYVWQDTFLEELFAMEKEELDTEFIGLKNQLEKEKVIFIEVQADNTKEAFEAYRARETILRTELGLAQTPEEVSEQSVPLATDSENTTKKKTLH